MSVDIPAAAEPHLAPRVNRRAMSAGPLAALSLVLASGAILISSCCALPLALAMAGVGGAWLSSLGELALYKNHLLVAAMLTLAVGWVLTARSRAECRPAKCGYAGGRSKAWTVSMLMSSTALVALAALSDFIDPSVVAYLTSLRG